MVTPPRERKTKAGWAAVVTQLCSFILISIAMFSTSWLQAESRAYGTAVERIGLWWQCFRSYTVPKDIHRNVFFVGCRWMFDQFTTGYEDVREAFREPFFVVTQLFFTICFIGALIGAGLSLALIICPGDSHEHLVLKIAFITQAIAFGTGILAVTVFGIAAPMEGWMPHPDHNLLSWSFACAVVGVVGTLVASILFLVEQNIQLRKQSYRDVHGQEMSQKNLPK